MPIASGHLLFANWASQDGDLFVLLQPSGVGGGREFQEGGDVCISKADTC